MNKTTPHAEKETKPGEQSLKEAERQRVLAQLQLINRLATRLPWIVLAISLFAFMVIFLQIHLKG